MPTVRQAADQAVDLVHRLPQGGRRGQHGPRVANGRLPGRGERGRSARAVEQGRTQVPLELPNLGTDAGLADMHMVSGAGEVRFFRYRDQVFKLT